MKKIALTTMLVTIFALSAIGQNKSFDLGFKASPGLSWYKANSKGLESGGMGFNFSGGFLGDFLLVKNYYIATGLLYNFQSGNLKYVTEYSKRKGTVERNYHLQYVEIPISLKLNTNMFGKFRIFGLGGFMTSFRVSATSDDQWTFLDTQETRSIEKEGAANNFAAVKESLFFGLGVDIFFDSSIHLTTGVTYTTTLSNVAGKDMKCYFDDTWVKAKFSNNILELRVGVIF